MNLEEARKVLEERKKNEEERELQRKVNWIFFWCVVGFVVLCFIFPWIPGLIIFLWLLPGLGLLCLGVVGGVLGLIRVMH